MVGQSIWSGRLRLVQRKEAFFLGQAGIRRMVVLKAPTSAQVPLRGQNPIYDQSAYQSAQSTPSSTQKSLAYSKPVPGLYQLSSWRKACISPGQDIPI